MESKQLRVANKQIGKPPSPRISVKMSAEKFRRFSIILSDNPKSVKWRNHHRNF